MTHKELSYQPKGGMCAVCRYREIDCSGLEFNKMKPIFKEDRDGIVIVKCDRFTRRET